MILIHPFDFRVFNPYTYGMKEFTSSVWEVAKTILVAAIVVFIVRSVLFQPFLVSGASMEPNISQNNYLIVDELTYRFKNPERGEVVVFWYPGDPDTAYIKRIIGLPGETVDVQAGQVKINGYVLDESSYLGQARTFGSAHVTLEPDTYFVMGDNRNNSYDSRSWGPLKKQYIVGRALVRLFPFDEIILFQEPPYQITN